jgi:hypothetical protein
LNGTNFIGCSKAELAGADVQCFERKQPGVVCREEAYYYEATSGSPRRNEEDYFCQLHLFAVGVWVEVNFRTWLKFSVDFWGHGSAAEIL